ncbi:MAG: type 4a pilus biogenesis protein PilO [Candidatus Omnitrophica bacterium]|nr:type 4a pilus biogenesis protein PilO [Candidatus Omnitrophota bacterium]
MAKIELDDDKKILVIAVAIGIVALFVPYKIYGAYSRNAAKLHSEIKVEEEKLDLRGQIAKQEQSIRKYKKGLYTSKEVQGLRDLISSTAGETGVEIISMQPVTVQKFSNKYMRTPIQLKVYCTYNQLGKFVNTIERLKKLTMVETIVIDHQKDSKQRGKKEKVFAEGDTKALVAMTVSVYSS